MLLRLPDGSYVDPNRIGMVAAITTLPTPELATYARAQVVIRYDDVTLYLPAESVAEAEGVRDEIAAAVCAVTGRPLLTTGEVVRAEAKRIMAAWPRKAAPEAKAETETGADDE